MKASIAGVAPYRCYLESSCIIHEAVFRCPWIFTSGSCGFWNKRSSSWWVGELQVHKIENVTARQSSIMTKQFLSSVACSREQLPRAAVTREDEEEHEPLRILIAAEAGFELRNSFAKRLHQNLIKPVAISSKYKSKPLRWICQLILVINNDEKKKKKTLKETADRSSPWIVPFL